PIDAERLALGASAWAALTSVDPRALAAIARTHTPALPHLGPALHRHLQELPSSITGLSLTQTLLLRSLTAQGTTVADMWRILQTELEPLPYLADSMFLHILNEMGRVDPPVYERAIVDADNPFRDRLTLTETRRAVLRGTTDWLSLQPPVRWVGGVRIDPTSSAW